MCCTTLMQLPSVEFHIAIWLMASDNARRNLIVFGTILFTLDPSNQ